MANRCYDWEKANILQGRNNHVTALLRRPKILTNHQHLNCQTYSNPYSNSHNRDGQSQSLRARFKPGFESCQAEKTSTRWSGTPVLQASAAPVGQKTRLDCLVPSLQPTRGKRSFFWRLCYFVDNVILYSRVAERSSCLFIIWPHSQPEASRGPLAGAVAECYSKHSCPNSSCHSLRWSWSAASFQTLHVKTQTNQWLRRPFSLFCRYLEAKAWTQAQQMPFINVNEACGL